MSVVISGALTDGAGIPMSGYHIILKSRVNTPEVVMNTVADVMTAGFSSRIHNAIRQT